MPSSWYSCACVIPSPWVWAAVNDSFIMDRIQQKRWNVTSEISCRKMWLPSCLLPFILLLFALREASCHVVNYVIERLLWQGAEGGLWPTASEEVRPSVQNTVRNWILQQLCEVLRSGSSLNQAFRWDCSLSQQLDCILVRNLEVQASGWYAPTFLIHKNCEIINVCCSKLLFWSN